MFWPSLRRSTAVEAHRFFWLFSAFFALLLPRLLYFRRADALGHGRCKHKYRGASRAVRTAGSRHWLLLLRQSRCCPPWRVSLPVCVCLELSSSPPGLFCRTFTRPFWLWLWPLSPPLLSPFSRSLCSSPTRRLPYATLRSVAPRRRKKSVTAALAQHYYLF